MKFHCYDTRGLFQRIFFALITTSLCLISFELNAGFSSSLYGNQLLTKDEGTLYGGGISVKNDFPHKFGIKNTFITADLFASSSRKNKDKYNEETRFFAPLSAAYPSWTPDGKTIIYKNANSNICSINIDGTNQKELTTGGGCYTPCVKWKPK